MEHGVRSSELVAGSSGGSFGEPPEPTGPRPVLPVADRPNGAAVGQPKASAAPPWGKQHAILPLDLCLGLENSSVWSVGRARPPVSQNGILLYRRLAVGGPFAGSEGLRIMG